MPTVQKRKSLIHKRTYDSSRDPINGLGGVAGGAYWCLPPIKEGGVVDDLQTLHGSPRLVEALSSIETPTCLMRQVVAATEWCDALPTPPVLIATCLMRQVTAATNMLQRMVSFFVTAMPTPPNITAPSTQVKVANPYCEHDDYVEYVGMYTSSITCKSCNKYWFHKYADEDDLASLCER